MEAIKQKVDSFFKAYEQRFAEGLKGVADVDGTVASFANCFVQASPTGVSCGKNDSQFREIIPDGYAFYKQIGTQSMKIIYKEVTILDDFHLLCKVHWRSVYMSADKKEEVIDFDVLYFLQHLNSELRIFAYITGDERKILEERGLL
jgi:hypothetical protein